MINWRNPWFSLSQQEQWFRCALGLLLRDFSVAQVLSVVGYVQGTVKPLFHRDLLSSCRLLNLIKGAVMSDSEIVLDRALFFDAENTVELSAVRCRPVQIGIGCRFFFELSIVLRQIGR